MIPSRPVGLAWLALTPVIACGCGLLDGGVPPDRLSSDLPGPFSEVGSLVLCLGSLRLDAPGATGDAPGEGVGFCVSHVEASTCEGDAGCGPRERCTCGRCSVPFCRTGSDCPGGLDCMARDHTCRVRCVADADCPAGLVCDPTTLGCAAPCSGDGGCAAGEVCSMTRGVCITVACDGSGCAPGRTCDLMRQTAVVGRPALLEGSEGRMWVDVEGLGIVRFVDRGHGAWHAEPASPVVEHGLCDPGIARAPGGLVLVAGSRDGSSLVAFSSVDGVSFVPLSGDGRFLEVAGGWETGWIGRPTVLPEGDGWLVAYEGGPGRGVGLVHLTASGEREGLAEGPILTADRVESGMWTEVTSVGSPFLFEQACAGRQGGIAMLFEAVGLERIDVQVAGAAPPLPNASVGYARLVEGTASVLPSGPFYTTMAGVAVTRSEGTPVIVCSDHGWVLYYVASDPSTGLSSGLFRALPY